MRNMLHELKRAIRSALRSLLDQDDHTRHAEDTTTHPTVWRLILGNDRSTYIPLPPGRHRTGVSDTVDCTPLLDRVTEENEQRRVALYTADASRRAQYASLALTSRTMHNADTTTFPRILA